uniref:Transmembrane protein n=1 Tax=Mesocestoides corti TaxID=53468 RepID=A0A5K3ESJ4_MESCO
KIVKGLHLDEANDTAKDSTAVHPSANLKFLRSIHERTKRKQRLRNCLKIFNCIFVYGLPIGGIFLGIAGILLGHFLHIEPIFVGGCLLLITAVGFILQACFWRRSLPNKFRAKEIAFNMPQEDSLISKSNERSDDEPNSSVNSNCVEPSVKSPAVNSAQVRRLSMALSRATAELSAARQITSVTGRSGGVLNLARRLTMAQMNFGDYADHRELESGNGWIAGRFPHGVRSGLAWNDTGASRFYASNYD